MKIGLTTLPHDYLTNNGWLGVLVSNRQANFGTVERSALSQQVADRILQMIRERQLKPGDRLPSERELATLMNVGRPALREALRALSMMNIIEIRQGAGAYITNLDTAQLVQHLDFVFSLDDSAILDLFDARKIVEVGIIELAAQRITDADIADLEASLQNSQATMHDAELFLLADLEMHALIARISRNPILIRFMESIHTLGLASRRRTGRLTGVAQQSINDHRRIVEALKARDPQAACHAMLSHLAKVEEKLKQIAAQPGGDD
jgi:GntR family transcriptional regulator, transcriptional repressor for pyruvate dehydrogenase complex